MNARITTPSLLPRAWRELLEEEPRIRNREIARLLQVSEAELLDSLTGAGVTRLRGPWPALLRALEALGRVMALSRNEQCVIEKVGRFRRVEDFGAMGQVLDEGIDLRLFLGRWASGYLVREMEEYNLKASLHFFDDEGTAIHKVYLEEESDREAFEALAAHFADPDQEPGLVIRGGEEVAPPLPDESVDVEGLRRGWLALQDTHDFHRLLRRFSVGREQAFRLVGGELAAEVPLTAHRALLEGAAAQGVRIMVFVGNRGIVQIHSGRIERIRIVGPWFNILDPGFNLHLREDGVASAWVVRKPTARGVVTALELFDREGDQIALVTGKRVEGGGEGENPEWRALVDEVRG